MSRDETNGRDVGRRDERRAGNGDLQDGRQGKLCIFVGWQIELAYRVRVRRRASLGERPRAESGCVHDTTDGRERASGAGVGLAWHKGRSMSSQGSVCCLCSGQHREQQWTMVKGEGETRRVGPWSACCWRWRLGYLIRYDVATRRGGGPPQKLPSLSSSFDYHSAVCAMSFPRCKVHYRLPICSWVKLGTMPPGGPRLFPRHSCSRDGSGWRSMSGRTPSSGIVPCAQGVRRFGVFVCIVGKPSMLNIFRRFWCHGHQ